MSKYEKKNFIILAHILTTVPANDLRDFLLSKNIENLLYIGHPLYYKTGRPGSFLNLYYKKKLIKNIQHVNINAPHILLYLKDLLLSLYWIIRERRKWDVIVALDNLNCLTGLILRSLRIVDKVIYYTIDFVPQRFDNHLLNEMYHAIDKFCVKHADLTWNISPRIAEGRQKIRDIDPKIYSKQTTVPVGIWLDRIKQKPLNTIDLHTLVYAGGLLPHQGVQLVLDAIPFVITKIPDFKFKIIGIGDYEQELKLKVRKLKIENNVKFLGYFEDHKDVEKELLKCGLAVAMYSKEHDKWSYYADPSKMKTYLAAGLPIITTNLTYMGKVIERYKCGLEIEYDKKKLAAAIIEFMSNPHKHEIFRENALKLSKSYSWNSIFENGIQALYAQEK